MFSGRLGLLGYLQNSLMKMLTVDYVTHTEKEGSGSIDPESQFLLRTDFFFWRWYLVFFYVLERGSLIGSPDEPVCAGGVASYGPGLTQHVLGGLVVSYIPAFDVQLVAWVLPGLPALHKVLGGNLSLLLSVAHTATTHLNKMSGED